MILRTRSTTRPVTIGSTPGKQRGELPAINFNKNKIEETKTEKSLCLNNFVAHNKVKQSMDMSYVPKLEIDALNELCNQLLKGQEELKERLARQEIIIESLKNDSKSSKERRRSQEPVVSNRSTVKERRLPAFTPRASEESGFFTFRPSQDNKDKTKFPRELFSRKSKARPQLFN